MDGARGRSQEQQLYALATLMVEVEASVQRLAKVMAQPLEPNRTIEASLALLVDRAAQMEQVPPAAPAGTAHLIRSDYGAPVF